MMKRELIFMMCALIIDISGEIYAPCDLARYLYDNLESQGVAVLNQIPLLVCVAGYHEYNSDYRVGNAIEHTKFDEEWNTTYRIPKYDYQGIFGLSRADYARFENGKNTSVPHEAMFFLKNVTHFNSGTTHPNDKFYQRICSNEHAKMQCCRLNSYVVSGFEVPIPLNPGMLNEIRQGSEFHLNVTQTSQNPSDEPKIGSAVNRQEMTNSESHVPTFLVQYLAFWTIGALFYVLKKGLSSIINKHGTQDTKHPSNGADSAEENLFPMV